MGLDIMNELDANILTLAFNYSQTTHRPSNEKGETHTRMGLSRPGKRALHPSMDRVGGKDEDIGICWKIGEG